MFKTIDITRIRRQSTVKSCRVWRAIPDTWKKAMLTAVILIVLFLVMKWIAGLVSLPLSGLEAMDCKEILAKITNHESISIAEALRFEGYADAIRAYDWANGAAKAANICVALTGLGGIARIWTKN